MNKVYKSGNMRGEKVKYPDGVGYTIWEPLTKETEDEEESSGICFDFPDTGIEDIIKLLNEMKDADPDIYVPDQAYEEHKKKREEKEKKLWYKVYDKLNDIGIHFTPFEWRFRWYFITRPVPSGKLGLVYKWCEGFQFGPIIVTWWR